MGVGKELLENAEKLIEKKIEKINPAVVQQAEKFLHTEKKSQQKDSKQESAANNTEQLSEEEQIKNILLETKSNLENLKSSVILPADQERVKQYIQSLLSSIKTLDIYDKALIADLEKIITDKNYDNKKAIEQMIIAVDDLEKKTEQLSQTDKQKILDERAGIRSAGDMLGELRQTITPDPEKVLHDAKEQAFTELTDELKKKWRCPNWVAEKIHTLLVDKYINKKDQNIGEKLLGGIAITILGLAMGKNWKTFFDNIDDLSFDHIKNILGEKADKWRGVWENITKRKLFQKTNIEKTAGEAKEKVKELTTDEIQKGKEKLEDYIKNTLKDINGKIPTKEQLERVVKKIDVSIGTQNIQKLYRFFILNKSEDGDGNYVKGVFELAGLPFSMGYQAIQAMLDEGLIAPKDVACEVVDGIFGYGLKGIKLFGKGMSVVMGKVSWKELGEELGPMYGKTPDQAKYVLASLLYRTQQNPVTKVMMNIAESATYIGTSIILDGGGKINSITKNVADMYNKNISTALQNMEDLLKYLPDGDKVIQTLKQSTSQMMDITKLLSTELPAGMTGVGFEDFVRSAGLELNNLPQGLQNLTKETGVIDKKILQKVAATEIPGICGKANIVKSQRGLFQNLSRDTKGFFQGEANVYRMTDETARYLDEVGVLYKDVLGRGIQTRNLAKLKLTRKIITGMRDADKAAFYARDVQSAEDMVKQLKFLAKESPSTLKFLIGKTPILLIGGLAFAKDGTPSEKMKSLMSDLKGLIPIVGPITLMIDAGYANKTDIAQLTAGGILLTSDAWYIIKNIGKGNYGKIGKYFAQPVIDVYEMGKFGLDSMRRGGTLLENTGQLIGKEGFRGSLRGMGETLFTRARLGKMALLVGLVTAGYFGYEYFFGNKIDAETQAKLAEYEKNPDKLDKEVFAKWSTLPQEERNDYLKAAVLVRGGFSPDSLGALDIKYDATKKNYTVQIPQVINGDQKELLKSILTDALSQLQPDATMSMQIAARGIVEYRHALDEQFKDIPEPEKTQKKREYIQAMGYDPNAILSA